MMKKCELCKVPARIFCDADQASLCWNCDAKVHGANFLVARHSRTLLCHSCGSLTPWKASGARLGNTVSFCQRCAAGTNGEEAEESEGGNDEEIDTENDDGDEDGNNQVVPWSSTPPPPASSSSGSECSSVSRCKKSNSDGDFSVTETTTVSLKRQREEEASDRDLQDGENGCWESRQRCGAEWREDVAENRRRRSD